MSEFLLIIGSLTWLFILVLNVPGCPSLRAKRFYGVLWFIGIGTFFFGVMSAFIHVLGYIL